MHQVTLIPGDGTGPDLVASAKRCVAATGVEIAWDQQPAGLETMEREGTPIPDRTLASIRRTGVALKGPLTTPPAAGLRSVNVFLRQELELYACLRPCKIYPGVPSYFSGVPIDWIIVRENSEDLYLGVEFEANRPETLRQIESFQAASKRKIRLDSGLSIKPISRYASERILRFAFNYARQMGRKRVTVVHKGNIMKATDGLFLSVAKELTKEYSDLTIDDRIVDNLCMQLVQRPAEFDVLVMPNLYGDIVSDLAAGIIGGLGLAPGANFGDKAAIFEVTHGAAPKHKGQNKVNPTAIILASTMMLRHLGEKDAADRLERAVASVLWSGKHVTYDLKAHRDDPTAVGTKEMTDAIVAAVQSG